MDLIRGAQHDRWISQQGSPHWVVTGEQISTMGLGRVVPTHELHVGFMVVGRLLNGLVIEFHQQDRCQDRFPLSWLPRDTRAIPDS